MDEDGHKLQGIPIIDRFCFLLFLFNFILSIIFILETEINYITLYNEI